ncbi:unnamed protein product [Candidula unifasciata]|uniref:Uncharacterized protein n=1 Tax=Candidula unifasciata TaxID=100452 RepID=A0A8S3YZ94_9EUPU|nr:unnamed protein product [Candidula unifasciata]
MFYGPEGGWPIDPYAAMYYGDPQAWMEYEAYYGPPNFGPRGMGRGFRGRGRGRGRGGFGGDPRGYNFGARSPREYSRSRSRSGRSRSWSRNLSRSRSRGDSVEMRNRSHSASQDRAARQSKRRPRSKDRSLQGESGEKTTSDAETSEKKKKKKKKKKKHKKLKKSKRRQKDEDNNSGDKNSEEIGNEITEAANISEANTEKEKLEEEKVENDDLVKKRDVARLEKKKDHTKHKSGEKGDKEVTKKVKEKTSDSKVRESGSVKGDKARSKVDSKTVDEQLSSSDSDKHTIKGEKIKEARTQKDNLARYGDGENKYKPSSSKGGVDKSKSNDPLVTKHKDRRSSSHDDASNVKRQGDRATDSRVDALRDKMYVVSDSRASSQHKQDAVNKQKRGISSEFDKEPISGRKYQYNEERGNFMYDKRDGYRDKDKRDADGAKEDRKGESRDRNVGNVNIHEREDNRGRENQDSIRYKQKGRAHGDRSESYDSARSKDGAGRNSKDGQKYKLDNDVAGRDKRSESSDRGRKITMIDNYKARKEITQRDGRSELHHDGKKSRIEGYKVGRETTYGDRRSESYDSEEGCKHKVGRDGRGESKISQSHGIQERIHKIDGRYKDRKGDSLLATKGNKLDSSDIAQRRISNAFKNNEKDRSIDTKDRDSAVSDIKDRNKLSSKQKISHVDNREESSEKTAGVNKDIHRKRQRSTSGDKVDDDLDKIQTKRIVSITGGGNQKQKGKNKDSVNEENKKFKDKSGFEGKQSEGRVKSDQNNIQGGEKPTGDQKNERG